MTRNYLTSGLDKEKASISLPVDAFVELKEFFDGLEYEIVLGKSDLGSYQHSFVTDICDDLELIEKHDSEPYEIWMEYDILEELYLLAGDCNVVVGAEMRDALKEFDRLKSEV